MSAAIMHEQPLVPPAPPGLTAPAPAVTGGKVVLTWVKPPRGMTHDVRRAPHVAPPLPGLTLLAPQSFTVLATGLVGTSYTDSPGPGVWDYQVRAGNAKGPGPWSQSLTVTV